MVRLVALVAAAAAAGCVDTRVCHTPSPWKVCAGTSAQPGASGTPPAILELSVATCAYKASPAVMGSMRATDPDGDVQVLKATSFQGVRTHESELLLDDGGRSGNDWSGSFTLAVVDSGSGMLMEGTTDVVMKAADRAGAQSVPYCNSITIVR
jgi:hypothetical protein